MIGQVLRHPHTGEIGFCEVVPVGRSRAATMTLIRSSEAGVSCWTAMPAARHSRSATVRRRFRVIQEPILRRLPKGAE